MTLAQRIAKEAAEQAREEGRQVQARSLIKLLTVRFKEPVPAPALSRIRDASSAELERWTERVLEAESVDDLLR